MRRVVTGVFALLAVLGVVGVFQREALLRLNAVNTLFAPEKIVHNFSNMGALFHTAEVPHVVPAAPLPIGDPLSLPPDWDKWVARRAVTGAVVLRSGALVHESYHLGTGQEDLRISWSVAKSYLSALFGVLVAEGHVENLDTHVADLVPSQRGSAYEGASIRDVLQMSSGVVFNEDYFDFWSDINKMGRVLALGGSMDAFAQRQDKRDISPGSEWRYVSIDTHVLAMVAREVTGKSLPELLGAHILGPLGVEGAPFYLTDGHGVAFALGGLNLTTRDFARLGEMFRREGQFGDRQIVPKAWVHESTQPSANTAPGQLQYGYQWWIPEDARAGEFFARGVYGQFVYVDKSSQTVIAINAADRRFRDPGAFDDALAMFRNITRIPEVKDD